MLIPRQLAPTLGLAHGGVEFLKGSSLGIEKFAVFHGYPTSQEISWGEEKTAAERSTSTSSRKQHVQIRSRRIRVL